MQPDILDEMVRRLVAQSFCAPARLCASTFVNIAVDADGILVYRKGMFPFAIHATGATAAALSILRCLYAVRVRRRRQP